MFHNEKILESKICRGCSTNFDITDGDVAFYESISPVFAGKKYRIPSPTLCPDCRQQRRLSFRNEHKLYKRKSDLSGKDMISMYSPDSSYQIYTREEWWSDNWSALDFGKDYDFSIGFFVQFDALAHRVPLSGLLQVAPTNADYTIDSTRAKNCYMCATAWETEDCLYIDNGFWSRDSIDGFWLDRSELCYDGIYLTNCHSLFHSAFCYDCSQGEYLVECKNVANSSFCVNLINASYHFLNKKYSPEEYSDLIKKLKTDKKFAADTRAEFEKLLLTSPRNQWRGAMNENVHGDNIVSSKNCDEVYDGHMLEDCKYIYQGGPLTNSYDVSITGANESRGYLYECLSVPGSNRTAFSISCWDSNNVMYSMFCYNCSNCFGCIGLRNASYCILNREYSREEYEALIPKIIENMQQMHEWGEFFPSSISLFGYNETIANEYFPLSADRAISAGFKWSDYESPLPKTTKIIDAKRLPDDIHAIPDDVLNWAIKCEITHKLFLITGQELAFYRKYNLPIPRRHPEERARDRMKKRNPRKLFDRKCAHCATEIETTYAPTRPEIVYCEACYERAIMG